MKDILMVLGLGVILVLILFSAYRAMQEEKPRSTTGDRMLTGCFQYQQETICDVWVYTPRGWTLCYDQVPSSIPMREVDCHE